MYSNINNLKIAIMTSAGKTGDKAHYDDKCLQTILTHRGVTTNIIDWRSLSKDELRQYDALVVTSTWDLHRHLEEFDAWIETCEEDGRKRLINDREVLKAGVRKDGYLMPLLDQFGIIDSKEGCIIPSVFIKDGNVSGKYQKKSFSEILKELKTENPSIWPGDVVIKPITSADGDNTYRLTSNEKLLKKDKTRYQRFENGNTLFEGILNNKNSNGVIIQPYMKAVEEKGEYQLVFINGEYTHATRKQKGFRNYDRRTQVAKDALPAGMYDFAVSVVDFLRKKYSTSVITRVRIDLFASKKGPILCEAELVEPNTNLVCLDKAQQDEVLNKFADAIIARAVSYKSTPPKIL